MSQYDALLVVSFGGPEGPDDVAPFLDNVFRGLRVTPETKAHVAKRYETFGGVSPINGQTRAFIKALQLELDAHGPALPIYWGNRNWHPLLGDTVQQMANAGVRRALAYVTSGFSSYSGCRKYREDLYEAVQGVPNAPRIDKLRVGYNHPGFIEAMADRVAAALDTLPAQERATAPILFSAHSLPESMARHARYEAQLAASCRLVGDALEHQRWRLVYQSNNASYGRESWLGPDIGTALRETRAEGVTSVVVAPIGFLCDHMEVVLDLDVEAAVIARGIGLNMVRAATVGTHPAYVSMVRELIVERLTPDAPRRALGSLGPSHDRCAPDCCLSGRPGPAKPSLAGVDDPYSTGD
ncbi:MAG TPA: ferrochelatase [Gammaproteobacteria bacterium]|nr:ferrochelatase [Gammaproteobacteria bacterium]